MNRRLLIDTMASQLPEGTIQLNARVRTIHRKPENKVTKLELEDGSVIFTKVGIYVDVAIAPTRLVISHLLVTLCEGRRISKLVIWTIESVYCMAAQVLLGCDGINSAVGKWMGLPTTDYRGIIAYRGMAVYPEGHGLTYFGQFTGGNVRVGFAPMTPQSVYWFTATRKVSPGTCSFVASF